MTSSTWARQRYRRRTSGADGVRRQVKDAVRCGPRESGYHARVWTTQLVRHYISTRFGIESCRERVRQLRHRHLKAKAEEQAVFPSELQALLEEWPEEWELIVVAEAPLRRHPTLTRMVENPSCLYSIEVP